MGRKRKAKQVDLEDAIEEKNAAPAPGGNRFNTTSTQGFVDRIENLLDDKLKIMMAALAECKTVTSDIKLVYDEAKEAGIPKKALRRVVKARGLEAKAARVRDELEGDDQNDYDLIRQALGDLADLPLGAKVLQGMAPDVPNVSTADAPFHAPPADTPAEPRTASEH